MGVSLDYRMRRMAMYRTRTRASAWPTALPTSIHTRIFEHAIYQKVICRWPASHDGL